MLNIFFQVRYGSRDLDLVLPFVLSPLLLEFELCAVAGHKSVNEVDLNLINIDHVGDVAGRGVESEISVNSSIIGGRHLQRRFQNSTGACSQSDSYRFFYHLQVSLGKQLAVDVLDRLLSTVDQDYLHQDVVVVHLNNGFSVDRVGVSSHLVNLLIHVTFKLLGEVGIVLRDLFSNIKVTWSTGLLLLELPEHYGLIWLSYEHILLVTCESILCSG